MKFDLDYSQLNQNLHQEKVYKYSQVKDRLQKVAFDVVRFRNTNSDDEVVSGLWQIQNTEDGEVIVAKYSDEEEPVKTSSWDALPDKSGHNVSIFYKNTPVTRLKTASLGIDPQEACTLCQYLPEKLATNIQLRQSFLNLLSTEEREQFLTQFPEMVP